MYLAMEKLIWNVNIAEGMLTLRLQKIEGEKLMLMAKKLNETEKDKIKNLCINHAVTLEDVVELAQYHSELIENKDYRQAKAIEYALYIIYQQASSMKIKYRVWKALLEIRKSR